MKVSSAEQCPLAGCGESAAAFAPHHDPFAQVVLEQLVTPAMTRICVAHADVLWTLYRNRLALVLVDAVRARVVIPKEVLNGVAWTLNTHNEATSKAVAALLATIVNS